VEVWTPDEDDGAPVDAACREVLKVLMERAGVRLPADARRFDEAAWVSYRLAELLSLTPGARQKLLELRSATERLKRLRATLMAQGLVR
jgi:Lon protease-like protein